MEQGSEQLGMFGSPLYRSIYSPALTLTVSNSLAAFFYLGKGILRISLRVD
jgi:hypothetical protein